MKFVSYLFVFTIIVTLLYSCTYKKGEMAQPKTTLDTVKVTYSKQIKAIITTYCLGSGTQTCHVNGNNEGAPYDFTKYADVKSTVDNSSFNDRVLVQANMPPANTLGPKNLTETEKEYLRKWLAAGAPNN